MSFIDTIVLLCIVAALAYFIPTYIAFVRGHPNRWVIFLLNLVFGITILGWFGCLIWASNAVHRPVGYKSAGGESGLNLFVNDEKQVRITPAVPVVATKSTEPVATSVDSSERLEKLAKMHLDGLLTAEEFQTLKAKLIQ
jgi:hypothetical protein